MLISAKGLQWSTVAALSGLLSGCTLPSQPVDPPIGLRVDDGVVSAIVPSCPGEMVSGIEVLPRDPDREAPEAWSGEGLRVDQGGGDCS